MESSRTYPTPVSWAAKMGAAIIPVFLALGLMLGVVARGWMRLIAVHPEFTWSGTLAIVLGFAFFAVMQSVAALGSARSRHTWRRRATRCMGVVGLLPLFLAAGAVMAPAVVLAGLAWWHPGWPRVIRWVLAVVVLGFVVMVSRLITSDWGLSLRSFIGVVGLLLVYACIVWMTAGTFSSPRTSSGELSAPLLPLDVPIPRAGGDA